MGGIMPTTRVTSRRYSRNPQQHGVNDETTAWDSDRGVRPDRAGCAGRNDQQRPAAHHPADRPDPDYCALSGELYRLVALVGGRELDGAAPHAVHVVEHALRARDVEAAPVARVVVRQRERAVVLQFSGGDARRAEVELRPEDRLADGVDVLRRDADLVAGPGLIDEKPGLLGESLVEPVADEAEVVLVAPHLARALDAVLLDDALPDREAEVVGIDGERGLLSAGERAHDVRVRLDGR